MKYCPECATPLQTIERDGHSRQICAREDCRFIHWNNPTPVVAAIIQIEDQVMLVHHCHWPEKMLGLVTGFLEADEHPDDAVKREIREETNLDTLDLSLIGLYPFTMQNQLIIAYAAHCNGQIKLNEELDKYKLLPVNKVKPWALGTGPAVRDWLASLKIEGTD